MALQEYDISKESWREYDWSGRVYRIDAPVQLFLRPGGSTHRVVDDKGVVHCVPSVGVMGCVLRWVNKDVDNPVNF
jgi:hypothetical protein